MVHSVEKIEKILTADPSSPDMEIFMSEDKSVVNFFKLGFTRKIL